MPLEGLLPGTPAIADGAAAPIPPPITRVPGLPPSRNTISAGMGMAGLFFPVSDVPPHPPAAGFNTLGGKKRGFFFLEGWGGWWAGVRGIWWGPPPPPPHGTALLP